MPNGGRYGDTGDNLLNLVHWIRSENPDWNRRAEGMYSEPIRKLIVKVDNLGSDTRERLRTLLFTDYPSGELSESQLLQLEEELRSLLPPDQSQEPT